MCKYLKKSGKYFLIAFFCIPVSLFAQDLDITTLLNDCKVSGSVTLYDYNNKQWIYSNPEDAKIATVPASTFKIFNSLVALEAKAIKDENEVLKWDSIDRGNKNWNADTDLKNAFKNSTLWFYQEVARRVGKKKYQQLIKKTNFGNGVVGEEVDKFWLDGSLAISPEQQIQFLVDLYEEKLPFSKKNMKKVKDIMIYETTNEYVLRAKTGWGYKEDNNIGWWVGYLQTNQNVYFFATRLVMPTTQDDSNFSTCRKTITYEVFKKLKLIS